MMASEFRAAYSKTGGALFGVLADYGAAHKASRDAKYLAHLKAAQDAILALIELGGDRFLGKADA